MRELFGDSRKKCGNYAISIKKTDDNLVFFSIQKLAGKLFFSQSWLTKNTQMDCDFHLQESKEKLGRKNNFFLHFLTQM